MPLSSEWIRHLANEKTRLSSARAAIQETIARKEHRRQRMEEGLQTVQNDLSSLRKRMSALEEVIEEQAAGLSALSETRDADHALLDSIVQAAHDVELGFLRIQEFPVDILRIIFQISTADMDVMKWRLSGVSQQWRDVALSTPSIWSICRTRVLWGSAPLEAVAHQFQHSGTYPLVADLDFRESHALYLQEDPDVAARATALVREVSLKRASFETLKLSFSRLPLEYSSVLNALTHDMNDECMPQLKVLEVSRYSKRDVLATIQQLLSASPALRSVNFVKGTLTPSLSKAFPPLLRDIRLRKTRIAAKDLLTLLTSVPNLQVFQFDCIGIIRNEADVGGAEYLQELKHSGLEAIRFQVVPDLLPVLARLHCPHLRTLYLNGRVRLDSQSVAIIRETEALETLTMRDVSIGADAMKQFVDALDSVQELDWISDRYSHDEFLITTRSWSSLASLKRLSLGPCTAHPLQTWLERRYIAGRRLECLELHQTNMFGEQSLDTEKLGMFADQF